MKLLKSFSAYHSLPSIHNKPAAEREKSRGVARIFQGGGHHPGIADYIWFIPLLSLVYQRAQSYYRGMKAYIN